MPRRVEIQPTNTGSVLILDRLATDWIITGNIGIQKVMDFVPQLEGYLL
jgi:hypothetical protein